MIISKDLFLLGEQDYLRLPRDERRKDMAPAPSPSPPETPNTPTMELRSRRCGGGGSGGAVVSWRGVRAALGGRPVLRGVSGGAAPGRLLAVLGPSGCGKTTLLDVLAGRRRPDAGLVTLNGERLCKRWRRHICYVLQQDVFFPNLTLRETLDYTAALRLPENLTISERNAHVEHLLRLLELNNCCNTRVGDGIRRGLSGGEKKRANIACELLTDPALMLLDEPTSGLDSAAARTLVSSLRRYAAQEHKTVILTVHQPSSQIFHMFDSLLLLCNGQTAYFGDMDKVVDFFNGVGLTMLPHYNPADFILEQVKSSPDVRERLVAATAAANSSDPLIHHSITHHISKKDLNTCKLKSEAPLVWLETGSHASSTADSEPLPPPYATSFFTQFKVLCGRNFKEARPRMLSWLNWVQTAGLALMAGALWFRLPRVETSLHDLQGWMFFSQTYWMLFALFGALSSFPAEREVVEKERRAGMYRLSAYYLAKMVGELPLTMALPAAYHALSYPLLAPTAPPITLFLAMLAALLLAALVAQSAGLFLGAACMDLDLAITVSALYTLATQLFGGYLATNFPWWLHWVRYTSMIHYAYQNMQILEFTYGEPLSCASPSQFAGCVNGTYIPAEEILSAGGCGTPLWLNTLALLLLLFAFRTAGYIVLRCRH
ncbi:ABC transporter G family member E23 [Arctopsyche grandis]|uniref:ABC transporter G family member E23 n=1 Tax=Arctopsyche grandis TaxID=121162 RepID=UPI00406D93C1